MPDGLITISNQPYLQTVLLHGHLVYPPSLLEEINNALSGLGKKSLSKRLLTFEWATKAQTGYRRYDLGIFTDREKDEDRLILTLFTGRARSASRKLLSEERHSEIRQVLAPMFSRTLGFDCNLAWSYPLDVATPLMNLPFELPVAVASELRSVRGLRVFNTDGTAWVILEQSTLGEFLHVAVGFDRELVLSENILETAIDYGQSLTEQVLSIKEGATQ